MYVEVTNKKKKKIVIKMRLFLPIGINFLNHLKSLKSKTKKKKKRNWFDIQILRKDINFDEGIFSLLTRRAGLLRYFESKHRTNEKKRSRNRNHREIAFNTFNRIYFYYFIFFYFDGCVCISVCLCSFVFDEC